MANVGVFRAGTSGLVLSEPNKKSFPIEFQGKSRLTYYSSKFNSIEINSSFYKIPRCQTYAGWAAQVPEDFQFTVKLWKGITHTTNSVFNLSDFTEFFSAINCLERKKGCLLIQFPLSASIDLVTLGNLLDEIKRLDPFENWRLAVEFRHPRWYRKEIYFFLRKYNSTLVLHDMPKSYNMEFDEITSFIYMRFHGTKGDYRGSYENDFLAAQAKNIKNWLTRGLDVYVYFNNTIGGAVNNLLTLKQMIDTVFIDMPIRG